MNFRDKIRKIKRKLGANKRLKKLQDGLCFYCDNKIYFKTYLIFNFVNGFILKKRLATRDHFIPRYRTKGKLKDLHNGTHVVFACSHCNHKKGANIPTLEEYKKYLILLKNNGFYTVPRIVYSFMDGIHGQQAALERKKILSSNEC